MKYLKQFFSNEMFGSILLIIVAIIAMVLANIKGIDDMYRMFLEVPIVLKIGILEIKKSVLLWINDALMAIFFLMIGIEVKRELVEGSLATNRHQAIFPIIAATGGMIVPAIVYLIFNFHNPIARSGWAIPTATDIAFALCILALLGNRIPITLKTFLMALAIIDDLGAILIIALCYTNNFSILSLEIAIVAMILLLILNICNIQYIFIYTLVGVILWIAILKSGVHPTLAGVITGFFIPLKGTKGKSPAKILRKILHPCVNFLILPLFSFANAGISLQNMTISQVTFTIPLGIITGLFIGKPLGINLFCWCALKLGFADLPKGITRNQIMVAGILCGIGFTMSIFISTLAFGINAPELIVLVKFGVLVGSLLSAIIGYILLRMKYSNRECF